MLQLQDLSNVCIATSTPLGITGHLTGNYSKRKYDNPNAFILTTGVRLMVCRHLLAFATKVELQAAYSNQ